MEEPSSSNPPNPTLFDSSLMGFHSIANPLIPEIRGIFQKINKNRIRDFVKEFIQWLPDIFEIPTVPEFEIPEEQKERIRRERLEKSLIPKETSASISSRFQSEDKLLFQFKINPLTKLKAAMEVLCDKNFNPVGWGCIDVSERGVEFRVRGVKTTGFLRLSSSCLIDFDYSRRCKEKIMMTNFRSISKIINEAYRNQEESITLFFFENSDNLIISVGTNLKEMYVKLIHKERVFLIGTPYPDIQLFTEIAFPSSFVRAILNQLMLQGGDQLVNIDVAQDKVEVSIGDNLIREEFTKKDIVLRGISQGHIYRASFKWPYLEMMKKASFLAPAFPLCFVTEQNDMIMTRFTLGKYGKWGKMGDLTLISKP